MHVWCTRQQNPLIDYELKAREGASNAPSSKALSVNVRHANNVERQMHGARFNRLGARCLDTGQQTYIPGILVRPADAQPLAAMSCRQDALLRCTINLCILQC